MLSTWLTVSDAGRLLLQAASITSANAAAWFCAGANGLHIGSARCKPALDAGVARANAHAFAAVYRAS